MSKVVVLYGNPQDKHLVLDSRKEKSDREIIEDVSRLTGVSPAKIQRLLEKYKAELKASYKADQIEDCVLAAAKKVRSFE